MVLGPAQIILSKQERSLVCFDVEAQFNMSSPNIFHGHFRLGSFHIFLHFEVEARASLPPPSYTPAFR